MANCPKCGGKIMLKKSKDGSLNMIRCANYEVEKQGENFVNKGTCDFRIPFKNKVFGTLTPDDMKKILSGDSVSNKNGDKMELDLKNQYFTKITFASAPEDEEF